MPRVHHEAHGTGGMKDPNQGPMMRHGHGAFGAAYGNASYGEYSDFDGNRGFDPDKWNDWWHERPERAFPRWLSRNQDCARPWYSGDVLTC